MLKIRLRFHFCFQFEPLKPLRRWSFDQTTLSELSGYQCFSGKPGFHTILTFDFRAKARPGYRSGNRNRFSNDGNRGRGTWKGRLRLGRRPFG